MIKTNSIRRIVIGCLLTFSTTLFLGCQQLPPKPVEDGDIVATTHQAAKKLISQSKGRLEPGHLIAASFANIDDLEESSTFGRIVAQQFATEFSNHGFKIVELLLRNDVYIATGAGEFLLSRAIKNLSTEYDAQAVIVGTYAVGSKNVYVTCKLIRARDSIVLASQDFVLPLGPDLRSLVKNKKK